MGLREKEKSRLVGSKYPGRPRLSALRQRGKTLLSASYEQWRRRMGRPNYHGRGGERYRGGGGRSPQQPAHPPNSLRKGVGGEEKKNLQKNVWGTLPEGFAPRGTSDTKAEPMKVKATPTQKGWGENSQRPKEGKKRGCPRGGSRNLTKKRSRCRHRTDERRRSGRPTVRLQGPGSSKNTEGGAKISQEGHGGKIHLKRGGTWGGRVPEKSFSGVVRTSHNSGLGITFKTLGVTHRAGAPRNMKE